jgi:hypothetical protein
MARFVPAIEIADDENLLGVGRPYGELGAQRVAVGNDVGAELVVKPKVTAFIKKIDIVVGEQIHSCLSDG